MRAAGEAAIPIPADVRELLEAPNYVHLSTLRADGSPRNHVVWVGLGAPKQERWMQLLAPCLPHLDHFVPSIEEARQLTGRQAPEAVAEALVDAGAGTVVLKMGEDGCFVHTRDGGFSLPV